MQSIGLGMVKARRMNPLEAVGAGHKCQDIKGIHAMLAKAKEIEDARKQRKQDSPLRPSNVPGA
jgi:quinone-modifying oxidoreductase subunit QmoC